MERTDTEKQIFSVMVAMGLRDTLPLYEYSLVEVIGDYDESDPEEVAVQLVQEGKMATLCFESEGGGTACEDVLGVDLWNALENVWSLGTYATLPHGGAAEIAEICRMAAHGHHIAREFCRDVVHTAAWGY